MSEGEPEITVRKLAAYVPVSNEVLMDMGLIPDTRPPSPPPSRRTRFRWWRANQREKLGRWLYEFVARDRFPDREDW